MELLHHCCAGLDVHKDTVVACRRHWPEGGRLTQEVRTFGTTTHDLLALLDWLRQASVPIVAMESTGVYWKPVFNILEGHVTVLLVNAQHIKQVPGRKTDVKDCQWIAQLLQHGLLKASFVPPQPIRNLRELTRQRSQLVGERASVANRIQKVLEDANIKLSSVASDVLGESGRDMLEALSAGVTDPEQLAALARGRMRSKIPALQRALQGQVTEHHRFLLRMHLDHLDHLGGLIGRLGERIEAEMEPLPPPPEGDRTPAAAVAAPDLTPQEPRAASTAVGPEGREQPAAAGVAGPPEASPRAAAAGVPGSAGVLGLAAAVALLQTIPGIGSRAAEVVVAEIGTDMGQFGSAQRLASWAGLCPGNHESAGKRSSGRTGHGNRWLKGVLVQAAWAASHTRGTYLVSHYRRLARRRGKKRALVGLAHTLLGIIYVVLSRGQPYEELGADYLDRLDAERLTRQLVRRLEGLGHKVTLEGAKGHVA